MGILSYIPHYGEWKYLLKFENDRPFKNLCPYLMYQNEIYVLRMYYLLF